MRTLLGCLAGALAIALSGFASAESQGSLERAIKATYLYKFGPFVEWPNGAFSSPVAPLNICIVGNDPFGAILDQAVAGQRVAEHPIALLPVSPRPHPAATSRSSAARTRSSPKAWARCAVRPSSPSLTCRPARPRTASSISSSKRTTCGSISTTPQRPRTASASVPSFCILRAR